MYFESAEPPETHIFVGVRVITFLIEGALSFKVRDDD